MELNAIRNRAIAVVRGLSIATAAGAAEVYRWVDEEGNVHYSQSLPPDFEDKGHDVLNSSGIVVDEDLKLTPEPPPEVPSKEEPQELPRDSSGLPRPKALYSEAELQQRQDNFLMLRYGSEQEILDAMDVEIKQLAYDRQLLETSRKDMLATYRGQVREAGHHQRAGTTVAPEVIRDINRLSSRLDENARSINGLEQREMKIRSDFGEQLERYRYLVEEYSEES